MSTTLCWLGWAKTDCAVSKLLTQDLVPLRKALAVDCLHHRTIVRLVHAILIPLDRIQEVLQGVPPDCGLVVRVDLRFPGNDRQALIDGQIVQKGTGPYNSCHLRRCTLDDARPVLGENTVKVNYALVRLA